MPPLTPHWQQPSHSDVQKVLYAAEKDSFTTKSISTVDLPPNAVFAKLAFPPCTLAEKATYATVQIGRDQHMNLNSDLVYINHGCVPSVIFDTSSLNVIVGPKGLKAGDELTFFYPSTEWDMAQGFDCFCGADTCRGFIAGAKNMKKEQLEGLWLNDHIKRLLEEKKAQAQGKNGQNLGNGTTTNGKVVRDEDAEDLVAQVLRQSLRQAELALQAAQKGLDTYLSHRATSSNGVAKGNGVVATQASAETLGRRGGEQRRGVTNRELSGEMGGDTKVAI
ncbi:putative galactose-proton symport [Venustampulla echinocandica]|uniref:Putative galactose-proton symport n=1 Tax=Venustampulla echinocandica TaxID=2656787 RepID=A0A370TXK7_9HELO|nr:putative galactose-proton symport [Venustampulla echinocandica]RDL40274.1 putative galactose-proton symport [Venustampulla echinocandica]